MKIINVYEFSEYPGLRHCKISDDSGEEFYHKILNENFYDAIKSNEKLIVNLDGTAGYAPSFLDEAFGNLIYDFGLKNVEKYLELISNEEPDLIDILKNETFQQWQIRREKNNSPKKTTNHERWHIFTDGKFSYSS